MRTSHGVDGALNALLNIFLGKPIAVTAAPFVVVDIECDFIGFLNSFSREIDLLKAKAIQQI